VVASIAGINFATIGFALFLLVVVVGYWLLPRRLRLWWLLGVSLLFYASWNVGYVPGFLLLIGANYALGLAAAGRYARAATTTAIVLDLAVLGIFKYLDVALGSSASLISGLTGEPVEWGVLGLALPLAISFVTFTLIGYVVDVYRGAPPERDPLAFAVFIAFFPRVLAGPIMRGHEFLPQLRFHRRFRISLVHMAVPLLVSGLLKKALADQLDPVVRDGFGDIGGYSSLALLTVAAAWTVQLYLDFAGYTDMARGSARLLGIGISRNFAWPYRALSMSEFWHRWHITLGTWLRDYLYFPLGGSRRGSVRTYLNLMVTMTLAGLWHGAGLGFMAWGLLQGIGLSVNRWWRRLPTHPVLPVAVSWLVTFAFVVLARVPFVAPDLGTAAEFYWRMVVPHGGVPPSWASLLALGLFVAGQWTGWPPIARRVAPKRTARRWLAYGVALAVALVLLPPGAPDFIYQQF
jgi:D-alanyl-lipoteichoic acid acyltransferase DltB (MBOAT superfamily)